VTITESVLEDALATRDQQPIDDSGPMAVGTLDLDTTRYEQVSDGHNGVVPTRALVLLRSNGWPIGLDEFELIDGRPSGAISAQLDREVLASPSRSVTDLPPLSVVVCTRNRPALLERLLADLLPLLDVDDELIVVDNAPDDDATAQVVAKHAPRVRRIVEPTPGLANARNSGLSAATNVFVVFTDDDVKPDPGWLTVIKSTFVAHPGAVCVSGSVLPQSLGTVAERYFQEFGGYVSDFRETEYHLSLDPMPSPIFPFHPRLLGTGANMAFRAEALLAIGGFDSALGAGTKSRGGEDIDIAVRLLMAGHLLVRQPAAVVWHPSHRSLAALRSQIEDYGCGLAAVMFKFATQRSTSMKLLRRVPHGLRTLVARDSSKNSKRTTSYPRSLKWAELRGISLGAFAYRAALRERRRFEERHG